MKAISATTKTPANSSKVFTPESRMKTLSDWERHIELKWLESKGAISPETYSPLDPDSGTLFYKAVSNYRRANDTGDEKTKAYHLTESAESAGKFAKIAVERGNLDSIRNLYRVMTKIKKGGRAKVDGHAKGIVGGALMKFLWEVERLPKDRQELREHVARTKCDVSRITPRNLAAALEFYSLNETIRDKTGPKPEK